MYKSAKLHLWAVLFALLGLVACSDGNDTLPEEERIGFEIIQILGPTELRAWIGTEITREEFAALEVPTGWIKNQPREGGEDVDGPDGGRFLRSPDATEDGEFLQEEFFGYNWFHAATIVQVGRAMDDERILTGSSVRKFHELDFNDGSPMVLLISPEGSVYFRIGRDADRLTDVPTIPEGWRLMDYTTHVDIVFELYPRNTVIRTDNQDSFQGPVLIQDLVDKGEVPDPINIAPLELATDICEDANNMAAILDSYAWRYLLEDSKLNLEQVDRMIAEPTRGPFYMLNLIRYREFAEYADGRETDLTGREANALYSPLEFLAGIGAAPVFVSGVSEQVEGDDYFWDDVAFVRYPCPAGFFAMAGNPDFRARLIHKDAGVETTIVMVTYPRPSSIPDDFEFPSPAFPATSGDPSFEWVRVLDFNEVAQYPESAGEPERTGAEAWAEFEKSSAIATDIGIQPIAAFDVQGVITGPANNSWDRAIVEFVPSMAGFDALLGDPTRQAGSYHRDAALAVDSELRPVGGDGVVIGKLAAVHEKRDADGCDPLGGGPDIGQGVVGPWRGAGFVGVACPQINHQFALVNDGKGGADFEIVFEVVSKVRAHRLKGCGAGAVDLGHGHGHGGLPECFANAFARRLWGHRGAVKEKGALVRRHGKRPRG